MRFLLIALLFFAFSFPVSAQNGADSYILPKMFAIETHETPNEFMLENHGRPPLPQRRPSRFFASKEYLKSLKRKKEPAVALSLSSEIIRLESKDVLQSILE